MKLPTLRQVIVTLVVVFVVYAIFTSPDSSADTTAGLWGHVKDGADALSTFFDGLLSS